MPAKRPCDPTLPDALAAVAGALTRASAAALQTSNELLAHYGDTGDYSTQRVLDTTIDHAADALRSITDYLADLSDELGPGA
jgi:hypothetical protein